MAETVRYEVDGAIATITLDRPDAANAQSSQLIDELDAAFDRAEADDTVRVIVLAANGIGTPRLLLNSRSARFPDGLANRNGFVGRNLMFHPYAFVRGTFDRPLGGHR